MRTSWLDHVVSWVGRSFESGRLAAAAAAWRIEQSQDHD